MSKEIFNWICGHWSVIAGTASNIAGVVGFALSVWNWRQARLRLDVDFFDVNGLPAIQVRNLSSFPVYLERVGPWEQGAFVADASTELSNGPVRLEARASWEGLLNPDFRDLQCLSLTKPDCVAAVKTCCNSYWKGKLHYSDFLLQPQRRRRAG